MTTTITPDEFLASLDKWGVSWAFYSTRADWLTHNRNAARNNASATPGGFGPLSGVVAHNTAGTAQAGMIDYLYRGDAARNLPGPLAHCGILKAPTTRWSGAMVVLLGWGTTNHAGPSDPKVFARMKADTLPLDRELRPTTSGPTDPGAVLVAPYLLGFEMCHAAEGPTAEQYRQAVLWTCACLDVMGGPARGYSAGSFAMHRELTLSRSDPQGVGKAQLRRDVAAAFKAGPPKPPTPTPIWEDDEMLSPEALEQVRQVVRDVMKEKDTANYPWTGHQILVDARPIGDPTQRVTPSTLLEYIARNTPEVPLAEPPK